MAANVVEGLSGGFPTMIMSCYAYLTQICRNDKLTTRLTAIDATCGLCGAICQVIMGLAISHIGYMWPFIMVIGLHLVNFIYVLLFVPELKKEVKHDRHYVPVTKVYHPGKVMLMMRMVMMMMMMMMMMVVVVVVVVVMMMMMIIIIIITKTIAISVGNYPLN